MASYSHHILLCPIDLGEIEYLKVGKNEFWDDFHFRIEKPQDYSEMEYFYSFVNYPLFEKVGPVKRFRHTKYGKENGGKFSFSHSGTIFDLEIEDITLNIYETGIGLIAFHLDNSKYNELATIKLINDVARRMFPSFLSSGENWTALPKSKFLADYIKIYSDDRSTTKKSDFDDFSSSTLLEKRMRTYRNNGDYRIPTYLRGLIDQLNVENLNPRLLIDDRMFVTSWIGSDVKSLAVKTGQLDYLNDEEWHNLIFCDKLTEGNVSNSKFRKRLNEAHTYDRWAGAGTLYGITRYSFIMLTEGGYFGSNILKGHLTTMYFQMVQLCLVQRASILKFSNRAAKLAGNIEKDMDQDDMEQLKHMKISYIRFMNRLYFREITAQEQGIDLYNMLHKHMRIPQQLKELDNEITEMVQLMNILQSERDNELSKTQNDRLENLTKVATIFLIPSLITGLLGVNIVNLGADESTNWNILGWICFILLGLLSVIVINYAVDKLTFDWIKEKKESHFFITISGITIFLLGLLTMFFIMKF